MDESIGLLKKQAYYKGFIEGYQRGIEDCKSGKETTRVDPECLDCPLQFLNLSTRTFNSLNRAGYSRIQDIVSLRKQEIWKIRNLGIKGLREIAWALWERGIRYTEWNEWLYSD